MNNHNNHLKIGVIGIGVGRLHVEGYQALEDVDVVAICDSSTKALESVGKQYNIPVRYTDYKTMLASEELDAVSIALPNNLHAPVSIAALEAGLHVLCEKPLAENSVSGQAIVDAAAQSAGKFMICFNRRYRPDVLWIKDALANGTLGRIYQVRAGWLRETGIPARTGWFTNKEKAGGGALIDLGVHILDLVMWLLDYPQPLTVSGDVQANFGPHQKKVWRKRESVFTDQNVEDLATAFIRLNKGINVHLETSWASHGRPGMDDYYLTLMGTEGTVELYVKNYAAENTLTLYTEINNTPVTVNPAVIGQMIDHSYAMAEFVRCIREDLPSPASAVQGQVIMQIIDSIYESAAEKKEVTLN